MKKNFFKLFPQIFYNKINTINRKDFCDSFFIFFFCAFNNKIIIYYYSVQCIREILLLGHRQAFAWIDEWYTMTLEDVRVYESKMQDKTNTIVQQPTDLDEDDPVSDKNTPKTPKTPESPSSPNSSKRSLFSWF